ncbi:ankyrin repeat protein [Moumouvirus australiensis]|uniref:Ankyrin repeat protein n=1 Tax=Moumouvirus australiensis TaxID=2109587 RepID=A0A2P1EMY2_9VIRU|nr:ankyrin repeat protein [Moumouvirus australiensis]AVL95247.1 ankyrin repeat protein [Moumouvirus australiensis]
MKKFNTYYKSSHNGKSKVHYNSSKRTNHYKINNRVRQHIYKQSNKRIKEENEKNLDKILHENNHQGSFLTPNGWIIADFITPIKEYSWHIISDEFYKYIDFYSRSRNKNNFLDCLLRAKINFRKYEIGNISHLMLACGCSFGDKNLALVKFLIKQGINVSAIDIFGKSALDYSLYKQGNIEIIKLLIGHITNKTLLNNALLSWSDTSYLPDIKIADILIKSGASINAIDKNGSSLLINIIRGQLNDEKDSPKSNFLKFFDEIEITKLREKNNFYETIIEITKFLLKNGFDTKLKYSILPGHNYITLFSISNGKKYSLLDYILHFQDKLNDSIGYFFEFDSNLKNLDMCYPQNNRMDKKQCYNKLVELFIVYGCEYKPYIGKLYKNHFKIIQTIEFGKKYFKTIKRELRNISAKIIYQPGGILSDIFKIQWQYHNSLDYDDIKKSNQKIFNYFGIGDEEKFIQIINSTN